MNIRLTKQMVAMGITVFSIAMLFVVGTHFDLFGKKISFREDPAHYLFFGSVSLGVFGALFNYFTARVAFIGTVVTSGIFLALFVLGMLERGELSLP
ncbi:MAG: hypothetical protein ACU0BK_16480 [Shimia sp.]|uniref:hypothetical protein n=1 Tax=Shimia sp. TaxID=1954381 RepID=UPI004058B000